MLLFDPVGTVRRCGQMLKMFRIKELAGKTVDFVIPTGLPVRKEESSVE